MPRNDPDVNGVINTQSEQYRRGQILGFTMAEIMLVLLFLLLLLLGSKIKALSEKLKAAFAPDTVEHQTANALKDEMRELQKKGIVDESKNVLWLTERLVLSAESILTGGSQGLQDQVDNLLDENKKLEIRNADLQEQIANLEDVIASIPPETRPPEIPGYKQSDIGELFNTVKGSGLMPGEAKQCLLDCGGGPKACWGESIKNPDYIFNVGLYDNQLYVTPNLENARKNQADWDSLSSDLRIELPVLLTRSQFQSRFSKLLAHGRSNECVYHVRLIDVATSSKEVYKSQRQLVENSVYISRRANWSPDYWPLPVNLGQ